MVTLIERTTRFSDELLALRSLRETGGDADAFATRARLLGKPLEDLRTLVAVLRLLRVHGLGLDEQDVVAKQLSDEAGRFASAYAADRRTAVGADPQRNARFWTPLKSYAGRLEVALGRVWSAHISQVFVPPPSALLDTLRLVPGFSKPVADVRTLMLEVETRRRSLPRGEQDFDEVEALAARLRTVWGEVGTEVLPAEVVAFLRAAGVGDARFTHLTPTVLAWIGVHAGVEATLRISFARDGL